MVLSALYVKNKQIAFFPPNFKYEWTRAREASKSVNYKAQYNFSTFREKKQIISAK